MSQLIKSYWGIGFGNDVKQTNIIIPAGHLVPCITNMYHQVASTQLTPASLFASGKQRNWEIDDSWVNADVANLIFYLAVDKLTPNKT